jgi:hypothetical protein
MSDDNECLDAELMQIMIIWLLIMVLMMMMVMLLIMVTHTSDNQT